MTTKAEKIKQQEDNIAFLKKVFKNKKEAYTILSHVSASGMSRCIKVIALYKGRPLNLSWHVAKALDYKLSPTHGGVKVSGCGMDMGFNLVYILSRALYARTSKTRADGGYKLQHNWL